MPVALGVVAAGTSLAGSIMGASAQSGIASAQAQQAVQDRAAALSYAAPTAQEISQINDRINQQQKYQAVQDASLQRDSQILSSLDPALITAGQQANQLMQGQKAAILAPMQQQQQMQRQQLQSRLAAQLGPGYETSSAGQAALQQFDMQASMQTNQAQMQAFNQISQFMGFQMQQRTSLMGEERLGFQTGSQMSAQTLQSMNAIQSRQENAILGTSKEMVGTAGSQYAGLAAAGKVVSGIGGAASTLAGSGMFSGGGGNRGSSGGSMSMNPNSTPGDYSTL